MNKYTRFLTDFLWFAIGNLGSKSIVFIMTPIYARYLSQSNYGKMDLINSTVALLLPLLSLRISLALFRFIADKKEEKKEIINDSLVILLMTLVGVLILSPLLYKISFLQEYFYYFITLLILNIVVDLIKSYLKSNDQVQVLATGDLINTLIIAISNIILIVLFGRGITGYFNSIILAQLSMIIFYLVKSDIISEIDIRTSKYSTIKRMILFSIPLIPNSMNFWIMNTSDRYIIKYFLGYAATGVFALAYKIPTIIFIINDIFQQSWQISGIENYEDNSNDAKKFNSLINRNSFSLLVLIISILIILIKIIMKFFGGENFYGAWIYVPFLLISTIFTSMSSFLGVAYIASKDTKGAFYTSIIGSIVNIILNFLLIPYIGMQAASISTLVAYFIIWILRVWETKKYFKIEYNWKIIILSISILLIQTFVLFKLNNNIILQLILLCFVLFLNREIILTINNIIKRVIIKLVK